MANKSSGMGNWMTGSLNSGGVIYPNATAVECTYGCIPCRQTPTIATMITATVLDDF